MENKILLRHLSVLLLGLLISGQAYGGDILFQEGELGQSVIYSVSPNGSNLKKIGNGVFSQWSPDRKYISYIKFGTENTELVVTSVREGKKFFNVSQPLDKGLMMYHTWNPKGDGIAFISFGPKSSVSYYDFKTKDIRILYQAEFRSSEDALFSTLGWSPDGDKLLFSPSYTSRGKEAYQAYLIDCRKGTAKKLIEGGLFPRFIGKQRILIVVKSEVWTTNSDGNDRRKIYDFKAPIFSVSKESKGKMIFLVKPQDLPGNPPCRLFLFNLEINRVEEINTQGYVFVSPAISSDGNQFAAIGARWKEQDPVDEGEGYYVCDLKTKKITLLKKIEPGKGTKEAGIFILRGGKLIIWD
jgi:Tol biopolymer transport system component